MEAFLYSWLLLFFFFKYYLNLITEASVNHAFPFLFYYLFIFIDEFIFNLMWFNLMFLFFSRSKFSTYGNPRIFPQNPAIQPPNTMTVPAEATPQVVQLQQVCATLTNFFI